MEQSKLQRIKKSLTEWGKAFTLQRLLAQRAKRNSKQSSTVGKRQSGVSKKMLME